jgi:hypothetical protein
MTATRRNPKTETRHVRCKRCGVPFEMDSTLADRLLAANSPNCPRCPECELRAKRQGARAIRAYHLFLRQCDELRRRDEVLRFSSTR